MTPAQVDRLCDELTDKIPKLFEDHIRCDTTMLELRWASFNADLTYWLRRRLKDIDRSTPP
jgi:hypothetical protein